MARQLVTRTDGSTIDLDLAKAETYDKVRKTEKVLIVDAEGNVIGASSPLPVTMTLQHKYNIDGSACSGVDGATGRTYNLGITALEANTVVVNRATLMEGIDYTRGGTTFIFSGINIYNSDKIMIIN